MNSGKYKCPKCHYFCKKDIELILHYNTEHVNEPLTLNLNKIKFKKKTKRLSSHMKWNNEKKKYKEKYLEYIKSKIWNISSQKSGIV